MRKISILLVMPLLIAACNQGVPEVNDPHNVVVDGVKMTQAEFLEKYCVDKVAESTCAKVANARSKDFVGRGIPRF